MIDFLRQYFQHPSKWVQIISAFLYIVAGGFITAAVFKYSYGVVGETTSTILTGLTGILAIGFLVYLAAGKK